MHNIHKVRQHVFYYKPLVLLLTEQNKTNAGRKEVRKRKGGKGREEGGGNRPKAKLQSAQDTGLASVDSACGRSKSRGYMVSLPLVF